MSARGEHPMAEVKLQEIDKVYPNGFHAVKDLSLDIEDGEFLVLVGPSGCGKTTALRMVAGLETITDGEVSIGGRVVNQMTPKDRDIAMVFQSYALYPHLSVADNIAFGLRLRKTPKHVVEERTAWAARHARPDAVSRPQAEAALRRAAAARRDGPRDRPRAEGVPHGRAALEPRREAARPDAGRDREAPARARHDDDLRDPRPGRGDDDGAPRRRDAPGRAPAGRRAPAALRRAGEPLRRGVHRDAADEHPRGRRPGRRGQGHRLARRTGAARCPTARSSATAPSPATTAARSRWASAARTCTRPTSARSSRGSPPASS